MINSLHLQNFKCFADQPLPIGPLTLLSGMNGMGKSTVLQGLLLLRQSHKAGFPSTSSGLVLNGEFLRLGNPNDVLYRGASLQDDVLGITVQWTDGTDGTFRFRWEPSSNTFISESSGSKGDFSKNLFGNWGDCVYLNAERIGPRSSFEMANPSDFDQRSLGIHGEFAAHYLSRFGRERLMSESTVLHERAVSVELKDQVDAWMNEISPGVRLQHHDHKDLDLVSLMATFQTGTHVSEPFRMTNIGFGITYTLPVVIALLSARPGTLLMIENPEAHLHPKGQTTMGRLIARASAGGVQVIVETHSDHVLNGIRLAVREGDLPSEHVRIHFFERIEEDGEAATDVASPVVDAEGRLDRWPTGFFDEWERSLSGLMRRGRGK